ncbi:MAG: glycosyltransferase family 39 protein, partial [Anaerolineales bacterium]
MNWKHYLILTLLSAVVLGVTASFLNSPGYMDAEYYYVMGLRIAKYGEFSEPFIWNYLTEIQTIPHPGFSYWMPIPALVSSIGMWITRIFSFSAARSGPIAIAALIPAVSMGLCYRLTGKRLISWLAGMLAVFPAFYSIFLTTTDSFGIMMLLGGIYLWTALGNDSRSKYLVLGLLTGLLHLTRPDGLLWFAAGLLLVYKSEKKILESGALLI